MLTPPSIFPVNCRSDACPAAFAIARHKPSSTLNQPVPGRVVAHGMTENDGVSPRACFARSGVGAYVGHRSPATSRARLTPSTSPANDPRFLWTRPDRSRVGDPLGTAIREGQKPP
jgi:hypothetical protein